MSVGSVRKRMIYAVDQFHLTETVPDTTTPQVICHTASVTRLARPDVSTESDSHDRRDESPAAAAIGSYLWP